METDRKHKDEWTPKVRERFCAYQRAHPKGHPHRMNPFVCTRRQKQTSGRRSYVRYIEAGCFCFYVGVWYFVPYTREKPKGTPR